MAADTHDHYYSQLRDTAKAAPLEPGVYLWRDDEGQVIYVGKARILRHRLSSYFSGDKDVKTRTLLKRARSIETIIVSNEYEALLLENTLIKQFSPKYNINLKDGKTYPVIRVTAEPFPRVFRTRRIIEDGSSYYGPFPNVPAVDTLLALVEKLFPLRKCRRMRPRSAPCMYFHIGRCAAPCAGKISQDEYARHVDRVRQLLSGETAALSADLSGQMAEAAANLQFERAARLRDAVKAIEDLGAGNAVVDFDPDARDYVAWAAEGILATFTVFSLRGGKLTGSELYRARSAATEAESLESFLINYYAPDRPPPPAIYLGLPLAADSDIPRWFAETFGQCPGFPPIDGKRHAAVLAMASQNAREDLAKRLKERGAGPALDELAIVLKLPARPDRIEGFDIAQLDGKYPVASLISFKDGVPDKSNYRHFRLRTVLGVIDDFQAMREAVGRRYSRLLADGAELPDLILIDGGIGQVNAARGVLAGLGVELPLVGLAKRDEELWLPDAAEPIRLPKTSEALKVLQHVRDETHRFATGLNQRLRAKDLALAGLEAVKGVGPARAAALMKSFASLEAVAAASAEEIAAKVRLGAATAAAVIAAAKQALSARAAETGRLRSPSGASFRRGAARGAPVDLGAMAAEALADYGEDPPAESAEKSSSADSAG